ncbi:RHS repeat-associated core domain-containing protein [Anoxybacter fermentans]|uniref:RHS repeat-associated core domain-containing protein n=1 Tax=Anoxybacter fermentans TaxID=1323375 RepID=UPI0013DEDA44|nr:RHS repeat-associated core domain-containing protein [Anoxybacter fermentans]
MSNVTEYEYDARQLLVAKTDAMGYKTRYEYDPNGNLIARIDPLGRKTEYEYDSLNRRIAEINALGYVTDYQYNAVGNLIQVKDPKGNITVYQYDGLDRLTKIIEANGGEYEYEYDKIGNLVKIIDPMENVKKMSYNSLNKLIEVTDAMGYTTVYQYDPEGMLTRIVDANGHTKEYQYDALDRLILEIDPLGNETRYDYDPVGNLAFKIDAEGRRTSYTYDPLDRLIQIEYQTGEKEKFEYDPLGRIIRAESPEFVQTFSYDKLGRKIKARNETLGTEIQYSYDAVGNLKTLTTPKGSVISYEYDALNRLVKANLPTNHYAEYEYDANNNLTRMKYSNGVVTEYSYDEMNRIKSIVTHGPYGVLSSFTYERDLVGNILKCTEEDGTVTLYRYDANYRLTKVIYPVEKITAIRDVQLITQPIGGNEKEKGKGKNQKDNDNQPDPAENFDYLALPFNVVTYEYDAVGNMIRKSQDGVETLYQYNAANQLIQAGDVRYIYDRLGNRIQKISPEGTVTYKYDYANRLSQVLFDDGTEVKYSYDALGRRVKREESYWHTSNQLRWEKTVYVYDGNRLLAEYDQHGGGIQPLAEYFTGNGNIIARKMYGYHDRKLKGYQPNTRGFLFFYHHDVNRNVMDITDRSGNSLFKYRYDAFGEVYAGVMEPYNHHGLTEKFYDTKVKLYHFKARDYDPVTGQWIQRDRYRGRLSDPRTLHGYMYAYQNPVRFEDPLGYDIDVPVTDPIEPVVGIPEDPEAGIRDMLDDLGEQINESGKIYGFGSQGEEIKEIQTILNEGFGKNVKVDGIYGQETLEAMKNYKENEEITIDVGTNMKFKNEYVKVVYETSYKIISGKNTNVEVKVDKNKNVTISYQNSNIKLDTSGNMEFTIPGLNTAIPSYSPYRYIYNKEDVAIGVKQTATKKVGDIEMMIENILYLPSTPDVEGWVVFEETSVKVKMGGVEASGKTKIYVRS